MSSRNSYPRAGARALAGVALLASAFAANGQVAQRKPYIVQLTTAPAATYEGGVAGLAATRPAAGQRINVQLPKVQDYLRYVGRQVDAVAATVPAARVYQRYGVVVSGFAALLTPDELNRLARTPGVLAITADEAQPQNTSYTTSQFLGLGTPGGAWSRLDGAGRELKGEGVIIAMVDGGVWPENVSVSDKVDPVTGKPVPYYAAGTVVYEPLPPGRYRGTCQAGEAFTAAMCNNKLVGAQVFNATMKAAKPVLVDAFDSPRDDNGHGTHTLTTAGGNANSDVTIAGAQFTISGVAPRARLASYKSCNNQVRSDGSIGGSCFFGDSVAAIEKAVADGVDVINFSIGGAATGVNDVVAQAMKGAVKAGVFVSASAGNSGPGNTVAHPSPWVATVGNSTHDRYTEATVTLGSGATGAGASFQNAGLAAAPLIWARDAGFGAAVGAGTNQALCFGPADNNAAPLLDPAKVAGKILVCDRGANVLVNKVDNAKTAGAVGVIILNRPAEGSVPASSNTTPVVVGSLPLVHMAASHFVAVTTEARREGGTAAFGPGLQVAGVVAPRMSDSSSRGPNRGDVTIMKPDITAPGTDIIAGYVPENYNTALRDEMIAGAVGPQGAGMISGTSMSSPHVAGAAALLRQQNPTWSPAAIKSALMTSALQNVKLASGAADTDRWGFGSGHLNPNGALSTTLFYDISGAQFDAYSTQALPGLALNLASITNGNVLGTTTTTRRLTNGGSSTVTLNATASLAGFDVTVTPSTLTLAPGQTASYTVTLTRTNATFNQYRFGELVWAGGGQSIRSPLTARSTSLLVNSFVEDARAAGSRIFTVGMGFTGPMFTSAAGMVPATRFNGNVEEGKEVCRPLVVPAGTRVARAQLYNSETEGGAAADLDLVIRNASGTVLGTSEGSTSNEAVSINNPPTGTLQACVQGFSTVGPSANFVLNTWVVGGPSSAQTMRAVGPATATLGAAASVVTSWNVAPGARYLGRVVYSQTEGGAAVGGTTFLVDATANAPTVQAEAPVFRTKEVR
jgi:subtilisin family serine protease